MTRDHMMGFQPGEGQPMKLEKMSEAEVRRTDAFEDTPFAKIHLTLGVDARKTMESMERFRCAIMAHIQTITGIPADLLKDAQGGPVEATYRPLRKTMEGTPDWARLEAYCTTDAEVALRQAQDRLRRERISVQVKRLEGDELLNVLKANGVYEPDPEDWQVYEDDELREITDEEWDAIT